MSEEDKVDVSINENVNDDDGNESQKLNDDEVSLTATTISDDDNKSAVTQNVPLDSPRLSENDTLSGKSSPVVSERTISRPDSGSTKVSAVTSAKPNSASIRPKSESSEVSFIARKKLSKSTAELPPGSHEVTFTVTISKAIPTYGKQAKNANANWEDESPSRMGEDDPSANQKQSKKRKRIVDAPKAQFYFHVEYFLLPTDDEPVKTDITSFGLAAKIYPERQEAKVLKTWIEDDITWVAWTHSHTVVVTTDLLKKLYTHVVEVRIWDTKDKVSQKARFDRPKAFRLPAVKQEFIKDDKLIAVFRLLGEDPDDISGVKTLIQKQAKNFVKQQPKKSQLDRPVPGKHSIVFPVRDNQGKLADKSIELLRKMEAEVTSKTSMLMDHNALVSVRTAVGHQEEKPSFSVLGDLARLQTPTENRTLNLPTGVPSSPHKKPLAAASASGTASELKGASAGSPHGKVSQATGERGVSRRKVKGDQMSQAQAEYIKKNGVCCVPVRLALLFAGMKNITTRLTSPVPTVQDCFVSIQLDNDLMTPDQQMELNPLVIKVHSVTNMPDTPLPYEELAEKCDPVFIQYQFFKRPVHRSVGKTAARNIYWDDYDVVLAGMYEMSELREFLRGPALEVQVHDRDRKKEEEKKLKPTLFGDDLEDEKISNVGAVSAKRTRNNPLKEKPRPWDPYGVAKFNLSELLLGQKVLYMSMPIHNCPLPDLLGTTVSEDGKVIGISGSVDGPEEPYLPVGHYLDSGATLKVKVELAHPLTTPTEVAAKPDLDTTYECPFGRIVFIFDYHDTVVLHKLQKMLQQINAEALDLTTLPSHVIHAALSTYKLSFDQQKSRTLNIATGFQVMDDVHHIFVIEGLRDGAVKDLWNAFPKSEFKDLVILFNSDLSFHARIYGPLDVDVTRIKLHEPLSRITSQPLLYVRDMVPKPCFEALVKLHDLTKMTKLKEAVRYSLFPSAEMVISMSREFGVPLTAADIKELEPREAAINLDTNQTAEFRENDVDELRPRTSRVWTPIDNYNPEFDRHLRENSVKFSAKNFNKSHLESVSARSAYNKAVRSQQKPQTVSISVPHNYSTQTLNSTALATDKVREILSKSDHSYTYAEEFHHSGAFVPVNVEQKHKDDLKASRDAWKTAKGWSYPGVKNLRQCNEHPMKPPSARTDSLKEPWQENILHANKLEPTLDRDVFPWDKRRLDVERYQKPPPEFGLQRPITIHLAGQKLKDEKNSYNLTEQEVWQSKVVANDPRFYTHRAGVQTELRDRGLKSQSQLTKLESLLKDLPKKYSLKHSRGGLPNIPPLDVVHNPSVDTRNREAGAIADVPVENSRSIVTGYTPGEFLHRSCLLEKNRVPMYVYDHKNKGYFSLYHKERSAVFKRPIIPLAPKERDNHYFRIPDDNNFFHVMRPATTAADSNELRYKSYPISFTEDRSLSSLTREKTNLSMTAPETIVETN